MRGATGLPVVRSCRNTSNIFAGTLKRKLIPDVSSRFRANKLRHEMKQTNEQKIEVSRIGNALWRVTRCGQLLGIYSAIGDARRAAKSAAMAEAWV